VPKDQDAHAVNTPSCANDPFEKIGPLGTSINIAPMNPITNPNTADRVSGCPRRPKTPSPAIQNADVPLSSAASLLGRYCMDQVFNPLLMKIMKNPAMVT